MATSRAHEKHHGTPHIDQEKSAVDIFEHVIRGVRLNRLRELLRGNFEQHSTFGEDDVWPTTVEPRPA